jgi:sugar-specific transcriptional regulator TrmB
MAFETNNVPNAILKNLKRKKPQMIKESHIQSLMDFGLSFLQAKVYLNLVILEEAEVKSIAQASNVARQDVYRIMPTLLEKGLGEKIIAKPTKYRATPLKKGLSVLLEKRKEECAKLQEKEIWLINNFISLKPKRFLQEETGQFKITSEITLLLRMHKELIQRAYRTIDAIIPHIIKPSKLVEEWSFLYELNAKKKGPKIRIITYEPEKLKRKQQRPEKNTDIEFRYAAPPVQFGMHIFDKKEVTISISEKSGLPSLWSNNPNILELAQSYFEILWNNTEKV